jgi:hypothetical protein
MGRWQDGNSTGVRCDGSSPSSRVRRLSPDYCAQSRIGYSSSLLCGVFCAQKRSKVLHSIFNKEHDFVRSICDYELAKVFDIGYDNEKLGRCLSSSSN